MTGADLAVSSNEKSALAGVDAILGEVVDFNFLNLFRNFTESERARRGVKTYHLSQESSQGKISQRTSQQSHPKPFQTIRHLNVVNPPNRSLI